MIAKAHLVIPAVIVTVLGCTASKVRSQEMCSCGPAFCLDTPEYESSLKRKKETVSGYGYPMRLIALYDHVDHCQQCIDTAPDAFNIMQVGKDGAINIDGWTVENENNDAKRVESGELSQCFVILSRHAIAGCEQEEYNKRPDYDEKLDLNKSMAINCAK